MNEEEWISKNATLDLISKGKKDLNDPKGPATNVLYTVVLCDHYCTHMFMLVVNW